MHVPTAAGRSLKLLKRPSCAAFVQRLSAAADGEAHLVSELKLCARSLGVQVVVGSQRVVFCLQWTRTHRLHQDGLQSDGQRREKARCTRRTCRCLPRRRRPWLWCPQWAPAWSANPPVTCKWL